MSTGTSVIGIDLFTGSHGSVVADTCDGAFAGAAHRPPRQGRCAFLAWPLSFETIVTLHLIISHLLDGQARLRCTTGLT